MAVPICPRCAHDVIESLFLSPVPGVWEVLQCGCCHYCWRTSEPPRRTQRDFYPDTFKMTAEEIGNAPSVPAVPPVRAARSAPTPRLTHPGPAGQTTGDRHE
ncbi:non-oxidative hydroxyarylic acid decarboxylases subunit D [Streptomyces sp. NPDC087420]|uniref:non-oxidative hydroxyarylic acid decarboxylases subunit D n=1 Tax=Streptomyces sp. NPDC087420 TaxID=3365785 RepID=UPI0038347C7F